MGVGPGDDPGDLVWRGRDGIVGTSLSNYALSILYYIIGAISSDLNRASVWDINI